MNAAQCRDFIICILDNYPIDQERLCRQMGWQSRTRLWDIRNRGLSLKLFSKFLKACASQLNNSGWKLWADLLERPQTSPPSLKRNLSKEQQREIKIRQAMKGRKYDEK